MVFNRYNLPTLTFLVNFFNYMIDAADKVSQKHFPIGLSIIDLLLINNSVIASPQVYAGIAALKDILKDAWSIIDDSVEKHNSATAKNEAQDY